MLLASLIIIVNTDNATTLNELKGDAGIFLNTIITDVEILFLNRTKNKTNITVLYIKNIQLNGGNIINIVPYDIYL